MVDNLNYNTEEDTIYVGYTGKTHEFMKLKMIMKVSEEPKVPESFKLWSGVLKIKNN